MSRLIFTTTRTVCLSGILRNSSEGENNRKMWKISSLFSTNSRVSNTIVRLLAVVWILVWALKRLLLGSKRMWLLFHVLLRILLLVVKRLQLLRVLLWMCWRWLLWILFIEVRAWFLRGRLFVRMLCWRRSKL